ncbi:MAG TPA: hypothetical protein VKC90_15890, partial [Chitinophagaceae bacterium]|nr:hypothetical protein [Chitinophagaceae bacterium]
MKVRWRQHEMTLVTMLAAILLARYLWMYNTTSQQFADPFIDNHVPFNFFRNVLLPDLGMGLIIYLCYLWISIYTIPRLLSPKEFKKKYLWLIIQILSIIFLLGTALNVANYLKHEWQFHYPGFSIFFNKKNPNSQLDIFGVYAAVLLSIFLYGLYVCLREVIIHFIEISGTRRAYRTLICNQVTGFLVLYITVPFFAAVFHLIHEGKIIAFYFSFIIPVFLVF